MPRQSKQDRENERVTYRIFLPVLFWFLGYSWHFILSRVPLNEWSGVVIWSGVSVFVLIGICFIPLSIRTIRAEF
jgi:hypothetical protein